MGNGFRWFARLLLFVALMAACSSEQSRVCVPGVTQACLCVAGMGVQACNADGSGFGECRCAAPDGGALDAPPPDAPVTDAPVTMDAPGEVAPVEPEGPTRDAAGAGAEARDPGPGTGGPCPTTQTQGLNVPWISQKLARLDWGANVCCGPAVITMARAAARRATSLSESDLTETIDWMSRNVENWSANGYQCSYTDSDIVVDTLSRYAGVSSVQYRNLPWCDFVRQLDDNHVLIFHGDSQGSNATRTLRAGASHWMILRGIDGENATLHDPGRTPVEHGANRVYSLDSVRARYEARGREAVIVDVSPAPASCGAAQRPTEQPADLGVCRMHNPRRPQDENAAGWFTVVADTPGSTVQVMSATLYGLRADGGMVAIAGSEAGQPPVDWAGNYTRSPWFPAGDASTPVTVPAGATPTFPVQTNRVLHFGSRRGDIRAYTDAVYVVSVRTTGSARVQIGIDYRADADPPSVANERSLSEWFACTTAGMTYARSTPRPSAPNDCSVRITTGTCVAPMALCGAACVNTSSDRAHCGVCNRACAAGMDCVSGACAPTPCMGGLVSCGGSCVNTNTDGNHCGGCGRVCPSGQRCVSGACVCDGGLVLCGGACVNTGSDHANCGSCGRPCGAGMACSSGSCVPTPCSGGQVRCGSTCVDTNTDGSNCGTCGRVCPAGQYCTRGMCACTSGALCGSSCVNLATDRSNCGTCGRACPSGRSCVSSDCACDGGLMLCGGACVNTGSDNANCGGCGRPCGPGMACSSGSCAPTPCPGGQVRCGSACVDTNTDGSNCGTCGRACPGGQSCARGMCTCTSGTACGASCVDTNTSATHCGRCDNACPAGQRCAAGSCVSECAGIMCPECQTCRAGRCEASGDGTSCRDDGNSCTTDTCSGGTCQHPMRANDCGSRRCGSSPSGCFPCGSCPTGATCSFGNCCMNDCLAEGSTRCSGTALQTCVRAPATGCQNWTTTRTCSVGCALGQCCGEAGQECCSGGACGSGLTCLSGTCSAVSISARLIYRYSNVCNSQHWHSPGNCYPHSSNPISGCTCGSRVTNPGCGTSTCWQREGQFHTAVSDPDPSSGNWVRLLHCFEGGGNTYHLITCSTPGDPPDLGWIARRPTGFFTQAIYQCRWFASGQLEDFLTTDMNECSRAGGSILPPSPMGYVQP